MMRMMILTILDCLIKSHKSSLTKNGLTFQLDRFHLLFTQTHVHIVLAQTASHRCPSRFADIGRLAPNMGL